MRPIEDLQNFLFVILLFTFRNDIDFKQLYFSVYTCNFSDSLFLAKSISLYHLITDNSVTKSHYR